MTSPRLRTRVAGLDLLNPIGLAAGFDKNAEVIEPLGKCGFGFIEVGAATPRPQPGNPKPRLFRLTKDRAGHKPIWVQQPRYGCDREPFGKSAEKRCYRLEPRRKQRQPRPRCRFCQSAGALRAHLDFATVNVSSPNTEKLRDLQGKDALSALLNGVIDANDQLEKPISIFLKIAPDLADQDLIDIAQVARDTRIHGIIATNTTLSRDGLKSAHRGQMGGSQVPRCLKKST